MKILIDLNEERVRREMIIAYLESKGINVDGASFKSSFREDYETCKKYYDGFIVDLKNNVDKS